MTRCPTCGQIRPEARQPLTPRELEVLTHWWMTGSVKRAAQAAGVGEQRAKNMLARARIRTQVHSNDELLAAHMDAVRSLVQSRMQHNSQQADAA